MLRMSVESNVLNPSASPCQPKQDRAIEDITAEGRLHMNVSQRNVSSCNVTGDIIFQ